jgi:hypothetical protein
MRPGGPWGHLIFMSAVEMVVAGFLITGIAGGWTTASAFRCRPVDEDLDVPPAQVVRSDHSPIVPSHRRRLVVAYGRLGLGIALLFVAFLCLLWANLASAV